MATPKIINKSHFGIYAIIIQNDSILLVRKSRGPYKGLLDLPGGRPEHGEIPSQTLTREVLEETGVVVHTAKLFKNYAAIIQYTDKNGQLNNLHHIGMTYLIIDYDATSLIKNMDTEDSLGAQWYTLDSLKANKLSPFANYAINDIKNNIDR